MNYIFVNILISLIIYGYLILFLIKMVKLLILFQGFNVWFRSLLRELANNIISIFFIIAIYLALWHFPQTVDLLLILNQADAFLLEVPLYFCLLLVSAFLIWNVPKYLYYHNYKDISFKNFIGFILIGLKFT